MKSHSTQIAAAVTAAIFLASASTFAQTRKEESKTTTTITTSDTLSQPSVAALPLLEVTGVIGSYSPAREPLLLRVAGVEKPMLFHWDKNSIVVESSGATAEPGALQPGMSARVTYLQGPGTKAVISKVTIGAAAAASPAVTVTITTPGATGTSVPTSAVDGDITTVPPNSAAVDRDITTVPPNSTATDRDITTVPPNNAARDGDITTVPDRVPVR